MLLGKKKQYDFFDKASDNASLDRMLKIGLQTKVSQVGQLNQLFVGVRQ